MGKTKSFGRKFFWSETIQNGQNRILKRKSRFRKKYHYDLTKPFFRKTGLGPVSDYFRPDSDSDLDKIRSDAML